MGVQFAETVTVCLVGIADETVSTLTDSDRRLTAIPADPETALDRASEDADCLVVGGGPGVDSAAVVERAREQAPDRPVVVFADPAAGVTEAALAAGATGVVAATGPDRHTRLARRVRTAVERSQERAAHEATRARFEALTENTSFAVVTVDEDSTVRFASDAVEGLLGYTPEELVGESLTAVMPERFQSAHHAGIDNYLETGDRSLDWDWIELPGEHRDGREIPLGISFGERAGPDGHLFTAVLRDISERKERQEQLDYLASAVESAMDGLAVLDPDGEYQYVNEAHAATYGYEDPAEMVGLGWQSCYSEAERERFEREVLPALEAAGQWRGEATGRRVDGSTFPQEVSLTELDDGGIVCVVRDITERTNRRQELREEQEFTESVLNALQDVFYVLDETGSFQRWNDRMCEVTGYTDAELEEMHALEVIPPDDRELTTTALSNIMRHGEAETVRSALLTKQGERIPHEFNGTPVHDADGSVAGLAGTGRDITQEQLREQRLDVLSRVLRHNVRNQMTVVAANADAVRKRTDDADLDERAEKILTAANKLVSLSNHAREAESLLRNSQPGRREVDLVELVEQGVADVETGGDDDLRVDAPESMSAVGVDGLTTAVTEIVQNAVDHTDDPRVDVTVRRETVGEDQRAVVRVADGGDGIPTHEQAVLTAGRETDLNHGIGIGLWLVNWLVTACGGEVDFERSARGGSEVVMSVPAG